MQIRIDVPHQVAFVAAQGAFITEIAGAGEVLIAFALLGHGFIIEAAGQRQRNARQLIAVGPACINPLIVTSQIDHATGMLRTGQLNGAWNRLILHGFTLTGVHHHAEIVVFIHGTLIAQPGLGLLYRFARVVERHVAGDLTRIGSPLIAG